MRQSFNHNSESGFTLMEIIVSTALFVIVVSAMLGMLDRILQVNRRVQAVRELVQGTRSFTETLAREVRNGRIDYTTWVGDTDCDPTIEYPGSKKALALQRYNGDKICFFMNNSGRIFLKRSGNNSSQEVFNSQRFSIDQDSFRMHVFPKTDPNPPSYDPESGTGATLPEIQPFVTLVARFQYDGGPEVGTLEMNYQTTISTDVYDVYKDNN